MKEQNILLHLVLVGLLSLISFYFLSWFGFSLLLIEIVFIIFFFQNKFLWVFCLVGAIVFFPLYFDYTKEPISQVDYTAKVTRVYSTSIYVEMNNDSYYIMLGDEVNIEEINVGQIINFECKFEKAEEGDSFSIFLKSNKAEYYCNVNSLDVIEEEPNYYRNILYTQITSGDSEYASYASMMIYGVENESNSDEYEMVDKLGITALIVISGLQISFLFKIINILLIKLIRNDLIAYWITTLFTLWFVWLTFSPPPAIRAYLCSNISYWNKRREWGLCQNGILCIVAMMFLILNPFSLMTVGMLLSFMVTFFINMIMEMDITMWKKTAGVSIVAFTISVPLVGSFNSVFNAFAPLMVLLFSPIITFLYVVIIFTLPLNQYMEFLDPLFGSITYALHFFVNITYSFIITPIPWQYFILTIWALYITICIFNSKAWLLYSNCFILLTSYYLINFL